MNDNNNNFKNSILNLLTKFCKENKKKQLSKFYKIFHFLLEENKKLKTGLYILKKKINLIKKEPLLEIEIIKVFFQKIIILIKKRLKSKRKNYDLIDTKLLKKNIKGIKKNILKKINKEKQQIKENNNLLTKNNKQIKKLNEILKKNTISKITYEKTPPSIKSNLNLLKNKKNNFSNLILKNQFKDHKKWINAIKASKKNNFLITSSGDKKLKIWSIETGELKKTINDIKPISCINLSKNEKYIICGNNSGVIKIYDFENYKLKDQFKIHKNKITSLLINDKNQIISSGFDGSIFITNFKGDKIFFLEKKKNWKNYFFDTISPIYSLALKSNDFLLSGNQDGILTIWDLKKNEYIKEIKKHIKPINCISFNLSEKFFLTGSSDFIVKLWNFEKMHVLNFFECSKGHINSVGFFNNNFFYSVSSDFFIRIYSVKGNKCISVIREDSSIYCAEIYNYKGNCLFFTGNNNCNINLYN